MIQVACVACINSNNNLQIVRQGQGNSFSLYPVLVKVITVMKDLDQSSLGRSRFIRLLVPEGESITLQRYCGRSRKMVDHIFLYTQEAERQRRDVG